MIVRLGIFLLWLFTHGLGFGDRLIMTHLNDIYAQMSLELYFTEAYKRACKIAYRYAR